MSNAVPGAVVRLPKREVDVISLLIIHDLYDVHQNRGRNRTLPLSTSKHAKNRRNPCQTMVLHHPETDARRRLKPTSNGPRRNNNKNESRSRDRVGNKTRTLPRILRIEQKTSKKPSARANRKTSPCRTGERITRGQLSILLKRRPSTLRQRMLRQGPSRTMKNGLGRNDSRRSSFQPG
jgi:hypothetical protein